MSRTERHRPARGSEWWGRRPVRFVTKGGPCTWWWKRRLHKLERRQCKETRRER